MTIENLTLNQASLKHRMDEIPTDVRSHLKMGFSLISRSNTEDRENFFRYILSRFATRSNLSAREAAALIQLDENTISDAISATSLSIGAVVDLDVSEEDFINFGRDVLFSFEDENSPRELFRIIAGSKSEVQDSLRSGALVNLILPSFNNLSSVIELRLAFSEEDEVEIFAPVAVLYFTTDCDDEVRFQVTLEGVTQIREKLEIVERRLQLAKNMRVVSGD